MSRKRTYESIAIHQNTFQKHDRNTCISVQKLLQIKYNQAKQEGTLKRFDKFKYQGIIYKAGDFVEIYHLGSATPYVAKLISMIHSTNIHSEGSHNSPKETVLDPAIQIQWYLNKIEIVLGKKYQKWEKHLSGSEVFASNQIFCLPIESILGKCQVLTAEEYAEISSVENSLYFTRFAYDLNKMTFQPDPSKWENNKYCNCNSPYNPDLEYVECQTCQKWFHNDCAVRQNEDLKNFVCGGCLRQKKNNKKNRNK